MILQALKGYYDRVTALHPRRLPELGFSFEKIDYVLLLSPAGKAISLQALPEGRQAVPLVERTSGIKSKFLWDNTSYVFGVFEKSKRTAHEHEAFVAFHTDLLNGTPDEGLRALREFLKEWNPDAYSSILGHDAAIDKNLMFQLEGDTCFLHERPAAVQLWQSEFIKTGGAKGQCLVSGFSFEKIDYVLLLSPAGKAISLQALPEGRQAVPLVERTSGIKSKFLWDNTSYVFGVPEKSKRTAHEQKSKRTAHEHEAFVAFHTDLLNGTPDEGLRALRELLKEWNPDAYSSILGHDAAIDKNLMFQLEGDTCFLHERPAAVQLWQSEFIKTWGAKGQCLVSGNALPIAENHPTIGGVKGAQTAGARIVSFNDDAYLSYGLKKGRNAPVSGLATFQYSTALNHLLAKGSRNKLQIADATTVFWAEAETPDQASHAEDLVAGLFAPPADDNAEQAEADRSETRRLSNVLEAIAKGRPGAARQTLSDLGLQPDTRIFILGLAPNKARIAIRFWHQDTLGDLARRFAEHWEVLRIDPPGLEGHRPCHLGVALRACGPTQG